MLRNWYLTPVRLPRIGKVGFTRRAGEPALQFTISRSWVVANCTVHTFRYQFGLSRLLRVQPAEACADVSEVLSAVDSCAALLHAAFRIQRDKSQHYCIGMLNGDPLSEQHGEGKIGPSSGDFRIVAGCVLIPTGARAAMCVTCRQSLARRDHVWMSQP